MQKWGSISKKRASFINKLKKAGKTIKFTNLLFLGDPRFYGFFNSSACMHAWIQQTKLAPTNTLKKLL
jgi:hypothetical protein